ncbi:glycosyltransferase [Planctellipticum variicoloris]|uniref:glycosyltransferase n=1 Tax=Planctellipticum variicoloris TaxID=3064265 RepID=UPI0030133FCC|nr:glycosyltransferase [Planctomycetaceae bacterium SH412]
MSLPEISVIIPTYNGSRFIADALRSVFSQTYLPCEIIVVDDCSTDDTLQVVEGLKSESPVPLRVMKLEKNSGGPCRPINVGVDAAVGELISVLDQDDIFEDEIFEDVAGSFSDAPECEFAFYWAGVYGDNNRKPRQTPAFCKEMQAAGEQRNEYWRIPAPYLRRQLLIEGMFAYGFPGFMFRKSAWERKRGVDESLRAAGDLEFFAWLANESDGILNPRIGYLRREHGANVCRNRQLVYFEAGLVLIAAAKIFRKHRDGDGLAAIAADRVRGIAYCFRQAQCFNEAAILYRRLAEVGETPYMIEIQIAKMQVYRVCAALFGWRPVYSGYTRPAQSV